MVIMIRTVSSRSGTIDAVVQFDGKVRVAFGYVIG